MTMVDAVDCDIDIDMDVDIDTGMIDDAAGRMANNWSIDVDDSRSARSELSDVTELTGSMAPFRHPRQHQLQPPFMAKGARARTVGDGIGARNSSDDKSHHHHRCLSTGNALESPADTGSDDVGDGNIVREKEDAPKNASTHNRAQRIHSMRDLHRAQRLSSSISNTHRRFRSSCCPSSFHGRRLDAPVDRSVNSNSVLVAAANHKLLESETPRKGVRSSDSDRSYFRNLRKDQDDDLRVYSPVIRTRPTHSKVQTQVSSTKPLGQSQRNAYTSCNNNTTDSGDAEKKVKASAKKNQIICPAVVRSRAISLDLHSNSHDVGGGGGNNEQAFDFFHHTQAHTRTLTAMTMHMNMATVPPPPPPSFFVKQQSNAVNDKSEPQPSIDIVSAIQAKLNVSKTSTNTKHNHNHTTSTAQESHANKENCKVINVSSYG
jgi:hypothetical protein